MTIIAIAFGGFLGAVFRFLITNYFAKISKIHLPIGTIIVNLLGSFLLGLLTKIGLSGSLYALIAIGFIGAFTTFSTVMVEMVHMIRNKRKKLFLIYFFITFAGCFICAYVGMIITL